MNDFVGKPFEPRELFDVLARHLPSQVATAVAPAVPLQSGPQALPPAVAWEVGLHRCLGRRELHHRILERFLATRSEDAARLQEALRGGDAPAAEMIAHTMVSTAGTIGADGLAAAARALQQSLQERDGDRIEALGSAFAAEHARVVAELQAWAAKHEPRSA